MDKIKLAHEALDLVFKANGGFIERAGQTEPIGKPTAMFEFSGHCPCIDVRIFPKGWHYAADYDEDSATFRFTTWYEDEELEGELNRLREYVEGLGKKDEQHD